MYVTRITKDKCTSSHHFCINMSYFYASDSHEATLAAKRRQAYHSEAPFSSSRQHLSYDGCLEVRWEIITTVLCCIVYVGGDSLFEMGQHVFTLPSFPSPPRPFPPPYPSFHSLSSSPPLPFSSHPFLSLPLEVSPLNPATVSGGTLYKIEFGAFSLKI